ncbi:MAG TPA: ATP-binding protein [Terriglobia bacterium]|jgi:PAS domain S-box-containing protein
MPKDRQNDLGQEIEALKRRVAELEQGEMAQFFLAAIVASADDGIISKTLDGTIRTWNEGAQRILGYTPQEIVGKPVYKLIPHHLYDEEREILLKISQGGHVSHFDTIRIAKDGRQLNVSLSISPIKDRQGNIIGASKILRDITERKRIEEERQAALNEARHARQEAEVASRVKDEFLATISHELRTPLTAVLGWVRMLRAGKLDPETSGRAMEVIDRNVRSQAQLIEDLLDISRITMGKLRLDVRPVQPASVISAAVESLRFAADARQTRIQTVLDSNAGPIVGDFERLQQVVWNLLSNAIKFTPKGGRVQVVLERVNSHIEIRVTDTGRGLKPEFLPYIFNRFSQAEAVTTRTHGGLGMGLAIAKAIVELHGGTITGTSEGEGKGATFTVHLPLMPISREFPAERAHPKAGWSEISLECPPEVAGLKVLAVDDDADTCDMIRTALEQCGAVVETAGSADAGFEAYKSFQPEVLISDVGMPEVDGYEFIRRVRDYERQTKRKVPAVALTAFARIEDRVKSLAAGYQMHVAKPVEPGELLTIVASLSGFIDRRL